MAKNRATVSMAGTHYPLAEVQDVIRRSDPRLASFDFILFPSGQKKLVVLVGLPNGVTPRFLDLGKISRSIRETLQSHYPLQDHEMDAVRFAGEGQLPTDAQGRIDVARCKSMFDRGTLALIENASDGPVAGPSAGDPAAPRNEVETALLDILREMIRTEEFDAGEDGSGPQERGTSIDADTIDMNTSFADGMNSLLITLYMAEVEEHFDVEVPLSDLYRDPTLRNLANKIIEIKRGGTLAGRHPG